MRSRQDIVRRPDTAAGRGLTEKRHTTARLTAIAAFALTPVGVFGPVEWVWLIVLALTTASLVAAPPARTAVRDIGLFLAFAAWATLSLVWSDEAAVGLGMLVAIWAAPALYLAVRTSVVGPEAQMVRRIAVGLMVVLIGAMLAFRFPLTDYNGIAYDYPGRHAAMALVAMTTVALSGRQTSRPATVLALAGLVATVVTGARTASAAIFIVLLVTAVSSIPRSTRAATALVGAFAAAALVTGPLILGITSNPVGDLISRGISDPSRPALWRSIVDACSVSPAGNGIGTSNVLANLLHEGFPDPHNEFIRFACDTGIVGSLALWSFFAVALWHTVRFLRARPHNRVALSGFLAVVCVAVFSLVWNPIAALEFMAPVMVAMAWADEGADRVRETDDYATSRNGYPTDS